MDTRKDKEKTLSALRVLDKLSVREATGLPQQYCLLQQKHSFVHRFFIVGKDWKKELEQLSRVHAVAEIRISN